MMNGIFRARAALLAAFIALWMCTLPPGARAAGTGGLQVAITPPEAVAAGAMWRRSGTTPWLAAGASETGLTTGPCTVEFKPVLDWNTPLGLTVNIAAGQTTLTTAAYRAPLAAIDWLATQYRGYVGSYRQLARDAAGNIFAAVWVDYGTAVILTKYSPAGQVLWTTSFSYLECSSLAVDPSGNALILGQMDGGTDWVRDGYDTIPNGPGDAVLVKVSPDGEHVWSTYLGGMGADYGAGVATDADGNIYATGTTGNGGWVSGVPGSSYGGADDVFVVKLAPGGQHVWSRCLGGASVEKAGGMAVDSLGNSCLTGYTFSADWGGAEFGGGIDAFVTRLDPSGQVLWTHFPGGANDEAGRSIALDAAGNAYVGGDNLPAGWISGNTVEGSSDSFVAAFSPAGAPLWSTTLGGPMWEYLNGIAADPSGVVYAVGSTWSAGWTRGGFQENQAGSNDGYLVKLTPAGQLAWSTFMGGSSVDSLNSVIMLEPGALAVLGKTATSAWPDEDNNIFYGIYLARIVDFEVAGARGALAVTITPPEVVPLGAQWRCLPCAAWRDSATTASNLPPGPRVIRGSDIFGWKTPPPATVGIEDGRTTAVTLNYERRVGALFVTISPPEAVAAGGQWRRTGTTEWHDSATTETGVPIGHCDIETRAIPNFDRGYTYSISISEGQTRTASVAYTRHTGTLRVSIMPIQVADAGAKWRRVGTTAWLDRLASESNVPTGDYTVEFLDVPGWFTAPDVAVTVQKSPASNFFVGTYERQYGNLRVRLEPPAAVAAGARWRRVGTTPWLVSDDLETSVPAGNCQIEFLKCRDWVYPPPQTLMVRLAQTTETTGLYVPSGSDFEWSTYLGGSGDEAANGVALDADGCVYVVGDTASSGWVSGGGDTVIGGSDGFVVKLSSTGQHLWSTYVGGSSLEYASAIALTPAGEVCVGGSSYSSGWVSGGYDTSYGGGGNGNAYVVKLSAAGQHLWSTYIGNARWTAGIAVDASGNLCVSGQSFVGGWASGGYDTTLAGLSDGFVARLSPAGEHLWSTYVGSNTSGGWEYCSGIAVDGAGNIVVTGGTNSGGWVSGGFDTTFGGDEDGFIVRISAAGSHLWSTFLGGTGLDRGQDVAVDEAGGIYATGQTNSADWPGGGMYTRALATGSSNAYALRLSAEGQPIWCTLLGGDQLDEGWSIATDRAGNSFLTGRTLSAGWVAGDLDNNLETFGTDAFAVKLSPVGLPLWSSYIGGWSDDWAHGIAADNSGRVAVVGETAGSGWTAGGYDTVLGGTKDGFAVMIHDNAITSGPLGAGVGVVIDPPEAVAAGAQWRRAGSPAWHDTGTTETGLLAGPWLIEFKPVEHWIPPAGRLVVTTETQVIVTSGTYTRAASLNVAILPPEAAAAGVQWRRAGTADWHDGGTTETTILPGSYTVEFRAAPGWLAPAALPVTLASGQAQTTSTICTPTAKLRVAIEPPTAVTAGAQWRRTGTTAWLNNGTSETELVAGPCTVEFKSVSGWIKPASIPLTLVAGQLTTATGVYDNRKGRLLVTIDPPGAVAAGAKWRRAGTTTYRDSGTSESVLIGKYLVEFKQVPGMSIPLPRDVVIGHNQVTVTSGTYVPIGSSLTWSTYSGGSDYEYCRDVAVDGDGNIFIVGETLSAGWAAGGWDTTLAGTYVTDALVAKLSPAGDPLWSTYLGGTSSEYGWDIAVDKDGNVYAAGETYSTGWVSGGFDTVNGDGGPSGNDGFLVKLSNAGAHLWSTYLGDATANNAYAVAVDAAGRVFVGGSTAGGAWIAAWGEDHHDTTLEGSNDGFVAALTGAGQPLWSTLLGGSRTETVWALAVDSAGNVIATGDTDSPSWVSGGESAALKGVKDAFAVKYSPEGRHLWSTFIGGDGEDSSQGIAADRDGNIYLAGYTNLGGWLAGGYDGVYGGGNWDGFVAALDAQGRMRWGTFAGGINSEYCTDIVVTPAGNLAVCGYGTSTNWVSGGYNAGNSGAQDAFALVLTPQGQHLWSILEGGTGNEYCMGVAADAAENIIIAGMTASQGWTTGPDKTYNGGSWDNFVAKIRPTGASLRVVLEPAAARAAGAQWRRAGTSAWLDSGHTEINLTTGTSATIQFKPVAGWEGPPDREVELTGTATVTTTGTYSRASGSLAVTIHPPEAVADGAKWRRQGQTLWRDAGTTETEIPAGRYELEFTSITGWDSPTTQTVTVLNDQTTWTRGDYVRQVGGLRVDLSPPGAVAAGAQWRRVGTAVWLNSGVTENAIPAGICQVEFKPVPGWKKPAPQTGIAIEKGVITTAGGTYERNGAASHWVRYK